MNWLRFDSLFWVGVSPLDRGGGFIAVADVAQKLGAQVGQRAEYSARDNLSLDFGEPMFDLVEPGGVGRREGQPHVGVGGQKSVDQLGFVRRKVVGNEVDFLAGRLGGNQVGEKAHELCAGVAVSRLAQDLAAWGLQGGVKRKGSVAKVFKTVRLRPPGGKAAGRDRADPAPEGRFSHPHRRRRREPAGANRGQ